MHEMGIISYIKNVVLDLAKENQIEKVESVTIEVGELSGAVPSYLTSYWDWAAKKEPVLEGAPLIIEEIKAVTYCEDCQGEYETVKYAKICPYCKSENTYLLRGNEYKIKCVNVLED